MESKWYDFALLVGVVAFFAVVLALFFVEVTQ